MRKKLITSLLCLLMIVGFNFALPRLMPGDTTLMLVGMDERLVTDQAYAYYRELTGADRPMLSQFRDYLRGVFRGDLGYSYHHNEAVASLIARRLPATLQIAVPAVLLSSLLALLLGCAAGMKKGKPLERAMTAVQITADAVPGFLLGLMLIALFSFRLRWLPMGALNSIRVPEGAFAAFADRVRHLALPVATLVIGSVPAKYLLVCNLVASQKNEKYAIYAKSRGLNERQLAFRHILPNIGQPFLTIVGLQLGFVVSGSLVCETIFSIKGMGNLIAQAITARDYPVLQGCLFVCALVIVLANVLTDLLCVAFDPKLRHKVHEAE